MAESISISLASEYDRKALGARWQGLAEKTESSFFLSWPWIETWLDLLPPRAAPLLLKVRMGENLVGLGLFGEHQYRGIFGNRIDSMALNETGEAEFDVLGIEYNQLLLAPEWRAQIWPQVLQFLVDQHGADEVRLSGMIENPGSLVSDRKLSVEIDRPDLSYQISLEAVRSSPSRSLLDVVGSSTRALLRKSLNIVEGKAVEGVHSLKVQPAASLKEALSFLGELKEMHQRRWKRRGQEGAFGPPFFEQFHRELIARHFDRGYIDLLKITAGSTVLGFLYNFKYRGSVLNYQCGFNYSDPKIHPGMLCHLAAVNHYAAANFEKYDLLAGDAQYKRSLSQERKELYWAKILRRSALVSMEQVLRAVKRKVMGAKNSVS